MYWKIVFLASSTVTLFSMPHQVPLTVEQDACFDWVNSFPKECAAAFNQLSGFERDVINNYNINGNIFKMAMQQYVATIFSILQEGQIDIPRYYTQRFVFKSMAAVKKLMMEGMVPFPIGPTTARHWVYWKELTEQDRALLQKDAYIQNPQAGNAVWKKFATKVVDKIEEIDKENDAGIRFKEYYENKELMVEKITQQKISTTQRMFGLVPV